MNNGGSVSSVLPVEKPNMKFFDSLTHPTLNGAWYDGKSTLNPSSYKDYLTSKGLYKYMRMWIKLKYLHLSNNRFKAIIVLIKLFTAFPVRTIKHFSRSSINRFLHEQLINSNPKRLMIKINCVKFLNHNFNIFNHE